MCISPVVKCKTCDREVPGSNQALCIFLCFWHFFFHFFQGSLIKGWKQRNQYGNNIFNYIYWVPLPTQLYFLCPQLRRSCRSILVSGCLSVCPSICLFIRSSKTVHAGVLKFHIWIPHGKIADMFFFLVRVISLSGVMPLWKNAKEIWCMPYLMNPVR